MIRPPPRSPLFPSPTLFRPLQPPDRAPADSLPACAEPGHLGHEAKNSLMPPAMAASLAAALLVACGDRKSTRLNSSHGYISYAVFCLKQKKQPACAYVRC